MSWSESPSLSTILQTLSRIAATEPQLQPEHQRLIELQEQLSQGQLHVAVLGQFKRGKSTFLNALLEAPILPVSVIPLTAVPVLLLPGPLSARIHFLNGASPQLLQAERPEALEAQLQTYVAEAQNPHNRHQVDFVEVFYPSALLEQGLVLIDTPGIGSSFLHNTQTTRQWLPHCDVALWVLSGDPPVTEAELVFLRELLSHVREIWVIFNKKGLFSSAELAQSLQLVIRNSANLSWSLQLSLKENFRRFDSQHNQEWQQALRLSQETLQAVYLQRQTEQRDSQNSLARIKKNSQAEQVKALIQALKEGLRLEKIQI